MSKYDKLKSTNHHRKRLAEDGTGHDLTKEDAEAVIESSEFQVTQPDGREVFKGWLASRFHRVVVSAKTSGRRFIGMIVTTHRDRPPKKK